MCIINSLVECAFLVEVAQLGQGPGQLHHVVRHEAYDEHSQDRADHPECPVLDFHVALHWHGLREQRADDDQVAEEDEEEDKEKAKYEEDMNNEDWDAARLIVFKAAGDVACARLVGYYVGGVQDEEVGCSGHNGHPDDQGQTDASLAGGGLSCLDGLRHCLVAVVSDDGQESH